MSMINKEVNEFKVQAYLNEEFKEVSKADILGKWSVFFFYPADFTFVCPTELEDLANKYASRIIEMKDGKVIKDNYIKKDDFYQVEKIRLDIDGGDLASAVGKSSSLAAVAITDAGFYKMMSKYFDNQQ